MAGSWRRAWLLAAVLLGCGSAALAQTGDDDAPTPAPAAADSLAAPEEWSTLLADLPCSELEEFFYREIPLAVYEDRPDDLYELVVQAGGQCRLGEPLGRIQILASIWDDNFDEIIYGYNVVGWLADRYDPRRQPSGGTSRAVFDTFTVDFANQMLPHVPAYSLEEFFCLFYAGQQEAAWALLQGEDLEDTWLRYYYDQEVGQLMRADPPYLIGVHGGLWEPGGDQAFVGRRPLLGVTIEQATSWGFLRAVAEGRLGRADRPYLVRDGNFGRYSDRWNGFLLAVEAGTVVWRSGGQAANLFVGLGYDGLRPFRDEDILLAGANLSVGVGYRWHPARLGRWTVSADARREWVGDRNAEGTPLGGTAYSVRLGLVARLGRDPAPRLQLLGLGSP